MLLGPTDVKRIVKTISIIITQVNWHFKMGPILLSPVQFIMRYPTMTPRRPYKHVEAPALIPVGEQSAEKILPDIAVIM